MNDSSSDRLTANLRELSRKTGLIVRSPDQTALTILFRRLEEYDSNERAKTLKYLTSALDETREALGEEPVFKRATGGEPTV